MISEFLFMAGAALMELITWALIIGVPTIIMLWMLKAWKKTSSAFKWAVLLVVCWFIWFIYKLWRAAQ